MNDKSIGAVWAITIGAISLKLADVVLILQGLAAASATGYTLWLWWKKRSK
jgi:hypothetical protein